MRVLSVTQFQFLTFNQKVHCIQKSQFLGQLRSLFIDVLVKLMYQGMGRMAHGKHEHAEIPSLRRNGMLSILPPALIFEIQHERAEIPSLRRSVSQSAEK